MKKIICAVIIFAAKTAMAAAPLAGAGGISANSPRALQMSLVFEDRLFAVIEQTGRFGIVNQELFKSELAQFDCLEEKCVLRFSAAAGIDLLILGNFDDRGDEIVLDLSAYGMGFPFNGRKFYACKISVPVSGALGAAEYSYIFEEHAGRFAAAFLKRFRHRSPFKLKEGLLELDSGAAPDGEYTVYSGGNGHAGVQAVGKIKVSAGQAVSADYQNQSNDDFVLVRYDAEAAFLDKFYYERKREMVFKKMSWDEKLYMALSVPLGSAAMPLLSPMGYFASADWPGLAMWSLNVVPYIYVELNGFTHKPKNYKEDKRDVPRKVRSNYYFAWYMLVSGGGSIFVDAFADMYLENAAMYIGGSQPYMGSDFITGYLALTTAGGGHFYKGYRLWGYLYFHAVNLLVYSVIREFSPPEYYDAPADKYSRGTSNRKRGRALAGALGALKLVELVHAMILPYRIENGTSLENGDDFLVMPALSVNEDATLNLGLQFGVRF